MKAKSILGRTLTKVVSDEFLRRFATTAPRIVATQLRARGFRSVVADPTKGRGTENSRLVNRALELLGGDRYLEIGVSNGSTLECVIAERIVGVDPFHRVDVSTCRAGMEVHPVPSDVFFARCSPRLEFDVVLVDGLHRFEQAYRDLVNAFSVLSARGLVILDDVVPLNAAAAQPDRDVARRIAPNQKPWMGDVYKTVIAIGDLHPELDFRVVSGGGMRHQAMVWRRDPSHRLTAAGREELEAIRSLDFEGVFGVHADTDMRDRFSVTPHEEAFSAFSVTLGR